MFTSPYITKAKYWATLIVSSLTFSVVLDYFSVPASYLLCSLTCAAAFSISRKHIHVPKSLVISGRGVVGAMIAGTIPISTLSETFKSWPLFILGIGSVLLLSNGLGVILSRRTRLPGTTAIWGTSPGAASAMVIMAENSDADVRLVALMQYLRVVIVSLTAIAVTHFFNDEQVINYSTLISEPDNNGISWVELIKTISLIAVSIGCSFIFRVPSGPILLTIILGILAVGTDILVITLPEPLLYLSYMLIGWDIGFRFNSSILRYALKSLPQIFLSIILLILTCALLSHVLVVMMGVDPLTAYLAMSPGGADTIAIIAASGNADTSFIMTMQAARLLLVITFGPMLARRVN